MNWVILDVPYPDFINGYLQTGGEHRDQTYLELFEYCSILWQIVDSRYLYLWIIWVAYTIREAKFDHNIHSGSRMESNI